MSTLPRGYLTQHKPFQTLINTLKTGNLSSIIDVFFRDTLLRWTFELISQFRSPKATFRFNRLSLNYCSAKYNRSWSNERSIEIPIAKVFLSEVDLNQVLEVGHTLSHYHLKPAVVIDKYEPAPGVINQDFLDFQTHQKFKRIISLSTFEHIGLDDYPQDATKVIQALKKLPSLLSSTGKILISFPVGYNSVLDRFAPKFFHKIQIYERFSPLNLWRYHGSKIDARIRYGWPYNNANQLALGWFNR